MKLRPKIDPHDYETKKGHVVRFLKAGDKVKVTIMFRGREQSRPELGFRLLRRLSEEISDLGFVEASPKQDGRNMIMVLAPHRATKAAAAAAVTAKAAPNREPRKGDGAGAPPAGTADPTAESKEAFESAEDEAPHRHGQAGEGDRQGQAPYRAGGQAPPAGGQVLPPHPPADRDGSRLQGRHQASNEAAGPLTRAPHTFSC
jgi:hypothetical protein